MQIEVTRLSNRKRPRAALLILVLLGLLLSGCSGQQSKPSPPPAQQQKPPAPAAMELMLKEAEKITLILGGQYKMQKLPSQSGQQASQPNEAGASAGQASSPQQGSQGGSPGGHNQPSTGKEKDPWSDINQSISKLHRYWNEIEPMAVEAGLDDIARDMTKSSLDDLTLAAAGRNLETSLLASISLDEGFAGLARVFALPIPADYFLLRHQVITAMVEAGAGRWKEALERNSLQSRHWDNLKVQAREIEPRLMDRIDFSLRDLQGAISGQSLELVAIKGEILLNNLKSLEKEFTRQVAGGGS